MSGQHALQCADERKSALIQLAVTVQAAARLAEVAHAEVLTTPGGAATVGGDTKAQLADAWKLGKGLGWSETIKAETERVSKEVEKSVAETGRLYAEAGKVGRETERANAEAVRAVQETERLKAEAMVVRSKKMKIDAEMERLKVEVERTRLEEERAKAGTYRAVQQIEKPKAEAMVRSKKMRIDAELERLKGEAERIRPEQGVPMAAEEGSVRQDVLVQEAEGPWIRDYLALLTAELNRRKWQPSWVYKDSKRLAESAQETEKMEVSAEWCRSMIRKETEREGVSKK